MAEYSQKWHNGTSRARSTETSDGLAAIQAQLNNLGREIKKVNEKVYAAQVGCEQCKGPHCTKDCPLKEEMSKVLQERGFGSLPSSTETNPRDQVKSILTAIDADTSSIRRIGSPQYAVSTGLNIILTYDEKQMIIPFPSHLDDYYRDDEKGSYRPTVKYLKEIAEKVLVRIGKFTFLVDFIILDMFEDIKVPLILERPLLSTARAKIDVYKRKITLRVREERIIFKSFKPARSLIKRVYMLSLRERMELDLEARRDQVNDLKPTIKEGKVVEEFRARNNARMINEIFGYPSDHDHDKKIHIDYAYNLKFPYMIDKLEYKGNNVVGALMNVPIFVGTFFVTTDFAVLKDMDDYRDEEMGDVIFDPRFKQHTNVQCNMIPPLLKVSDEDKKNGILHPYQKLKGFYKEVLNLGPDYIRDAKTEELLTCGHISVHEMEW
ncbi:gag-pol polyprotein [Tanacetum coccineum]